MDIVLHEIPFDIISLYQDHAVDALAQSKADAESSGPVRWAIDNGCRVKITSTTTNHGKGTVIYYADLDEKQQVEYILRFEGAC